MAAMQMPVFSNQEASNAKRGTFHNVVGHNNNKDGQAEAVHRHQKQTMVNNFINAQAKGQQ